MFAQLKLLAGLALVVALAAAGWHYFQVLAERDTAAQRAAAAELVAAGEKVARATEQKTARTDNAAAAAYQKELENGKVELQSSIARLRAQLRLRDQLAARAGNLPAAAAGAGQRDGETGADFLAAHGDDALRLTAEADDAVRQLSACQVILAGDRAGVE
ncbi:hypothetical protein [Chromobacterium haemolyticum]|uniref:hypothetical protein n=1 Tax=Chromobacterium haemolyticum TaxID=394935 RepID=UPI0009DAD2BB|nr:hypothetical protein [Chromobacterium haemolyticum]OQS40527.1 hypothetical protein B0T39_10910 [Chromobacterium haemolyticum]